MRKILILAGLLLGGTLFINTTPAQAWIGCTCVKVGAPAMCARGPVECTFGTGGACVASCDYTEPKVKKIKMRRHHRHAMKKKA
jgi:hypothetical protein